MRKIFAALITCLIVIVFSFVCMAQSASPASAPRAAVVKQRAESIHLDTAHVGTLDLKLRYASALQNEENDTAGAGLPRFMLNGRSAYKYSPQRLKQRGHGAVFEKPDVDGLSSDAGLWGRVARVPRN